MTTADKIILLVEDNASDEKLTLLAFKKCGVANEIVVVRDGAEALAFLFGTGAYASRDVSHTPQVILLDLGLPRVTGLEVLSRIRSDPRTQFLPVVILTSSQEERDRMQGYLLGANSYICKPVDTDAFTEAARELGLYWLVLNQLAPTG